MTVESGGNDNYYHKGSQDSLYVKVQWLSQNDSKIKKDLLSRDGKMGSKDQTKG
jgi:hypothetical protein